MYCLRRMADIYGEVKVLEHILEGTRKPSNLSYGLLQFLTENFSLERMMGHNDFGEIFKVKISFWLHGKDELDL